MERITKGLVFIVVAILIMAGSAMATDITILDKRGTGSGWYGTQENNEVEPGMMATQAWDLEAFYLNSSKLSMKGGWNFAGSTSGITSGDVFIDSNNNAVYGVTGGTKPYGYDFVFDIDWGKLTYNIYALNATSSLTGVSVSNNNPYSNPWQFTKTNETAIGNGTFTIKTSSDLEGLHYLVSDFDLSPIANTFVGGEFIAHFTMGCGNDNLMGQGKVPVPEPTTLLLLGLGLVGLAGVRGKIKK